MCRRIFNDVICHIILPPSQITVQAHVNGMDQCILFALIIYYYRYHSYYLSCSYCCTRLKCKCQKNGKAQICRRQKCPSIVLRTAWVQRAENNNTQSQNGKFWPAFSHVIRSEVLCTKYFPAVRLYPDKSRKIRASCRSTRTVRIRDS